jgi:tRNA (guanine37-N1)-methyltransferase
MPVKIDIVTIFPAMVEAGLAEGVVGRARVAGLLDIVVHNLRNFTSDRHHVVDDVPFGGGPGMVMKPEPFFAAVNRTRCC